MGTSRLALAVEAGALGPEPPARLAVFRPRIGHDLSVLPEASRVSVIQGFRPDHDHWAAQGYATSVRAEGAFDAAVVFLPRAKAEARALIAAAADAVAGGPVLVDGQKDEGVESLLKDVRGRAEVESVVSKAHGKSFWFRGGEFADWRSPGPTRTDDGFLTLPGVFSADGGDPGSRLLAGALPPKLPKTVVDLGAGWGYLSRAILSRAGVETLHLVEAEHDALDCAKANIDDPRAVFHWADALRFGPDGAHDAVVTNPPFHTGRAPDPALGQGFIHAAARMLKPSGRLWLVANRHLPYERAVRDAFADVREIGGDGAYKVIEAARPVGARHGRGRR